MFVGVELGSGGKAQQNTPPPPTTTKPIAGEHQKGGDGIVHMSI
jgi:hypothetical protein